MRLGYTCSHPDRLSSYRSHLAMDMDTLSSRPAWDSSSPGFAALDLLQKHTFSSGFSQPLLPPVRVVGYVGQHGPGDRAQGRCCPAGSPWDLRFNFPSLSFLTSEAKAWEQMSSAAEAHGFVFRGSTIRWHLCDMSSDFTVSFNALWSGCHLRFTDEKTETREAGSLAPCHLASERQSQD